MSGGIFVRALGVALCLAASLPAAEAQDLDAGKTPAQLFSSHCAACHKSPQGLSKQSWGLAGFLRQHYTTNAASASALAAYVAAAGPAPAQGRTPGQRGQQARSEPAPSGNGGDPRILREPGLPQAGGQQPAPEPPKSRIPRDPRVPIAVASDPQPFVIVQDPIPVPYDPTPRRLSALPSGPVTTSDSSVAALRAPETGSPPAQPADPNAGAPEATTTAALPSDQPAFSAPLP